MPKKIVNWTFGSFFRTIGRIIAYTLLGCLVGLLLNKLNLLSFLDIVNASTMPYTSAYLNVNQCEVNCNVSGTNCIMDLDNCIWDTNNTAGNSIQFGLNNGYLNKIEFNIKDSGDYQPGNYKLIINWGIDPRNISELNKYSIRVFGSRNNSNDIEISSTCSISNGTGNYDFNTSCNFSTLDKYDHFKILYTYAGANCTFVSSDNTYYCSNLTLTPQLSRAMSFNRINSFEYDDNPTNAINNQTTIINNNLDRNFTEVKETLTDDSIPSTEELENMAGWLPPGPVDSILNLPLTMLNGLFNTMSNNSCQPVILTLPFVDRDLTLPCIRTIYQSINAMSFINWVGAIASAFILFNYFLRLYSWVDKTLTFRENNYIDNWSGID